jgi:hypothetical protein
MATLSCLTAKAKAQHSTEHQAGPMSNEQKSLVIILPIHGRFAIRPCQKRLQPASVSKTVDK